MDINWLKITKLPKVDYVNRPAIDKRFIAIKMVEYKSVIPFRKTTALPEATTWDAGMEVKKSEVKDLKVMCTWYDSKDADVKGSYKLPHHKSGGGYPVVWNGVKAAMGALMGARGGVMLPASDRRGVYNHLAKHYKQFDKDVPEFKELDELDKSFMDRIGDKIKDKLGFVDTKIGRVLSKANETKLLNAADSIVKAGETIQTVLASVSKNYKKEVDEMDEKEVKELIESTIGEKVDAFKEELEEKLKGLKVKKEDKKEEEKKVDKKKEDKKNEEDPKDKKDASKEEKSEGDLVTKISDMVDEKFKEIKTEVDGIKKELNIKPDSDKKKVNKKDSDDDSKNDDEVSYKGVFGIKDI